jgi:hypothetical protein
MRGGHVRWLAFRPLQLTAAQAIGGRPGLLVLAALLRALAPATLPAATQPAAQADGRKMMRLAERLLPRPK